MEALILVATLGGPTMFARIGVVRALNRGNVREFDASRKDTHWGRRKLARDRWKWKPPSVSGPMTASDYAHTSKQFSLGEFG
jgi:hypothetical protein